MVKRDTWWVEVEGVSGQPNEIMCITASQQQQHNMFDIGRRVYTHD